MKMKVCVRVFLRITGQEKNSELFQGTVDLPAEPRVGEIIPAPGFPEGKAVKTHSLDNPDGQTSPLIVWLIEEVCCSQGDYDRQIETLKDCGWIGDDERQRTRGDRL